MALRLTRQKLLRAEENYYKYKDDEVNVQHAHLEYIGFDSPQPDSWDMENFHYIRSKSQQKDAFSNKIRNINEGNNNHTQEEDQRQNYSPSELSISSYSEEPEFDEETGLKNEEDFDMLNRLNIEGLEGLGLEGLGSLDLNRSRLEDCYLINEITIGNPSVEKKVTSTTAIESKPNRQKVRKDLSTETVTTPSSPDSNSTIISSASSSSSLEFAMSSASSASSSSINGEDLLRLNYCRYKV